MKRPQKFYLKKKQGERKNITKLKAKTEDVKKKRVNFNSKQHKDSEVKMEFLKLGEP